jgi:1-deoxy-D-xylulose-5-phosphate reductoisomerase
MKNITILGSTGSIGTQTLEIIRNTEDFHVECLAAGSNIQLLEKQIREFHPKIAVVWNEDKAKELSQNISDVTTTEVLSGMDGLIVAASDSEVDMVVTAVVGMIGITPTLAAIRAGKDIALANKETLVTAGHIIMPAAKQNHVHIYPVDSEHSAIYQSLKNEEKRKVRRILLTASGGPFRGYSLEQLKSVTLQDALKHPNWSMGRKITIDSSTMVNKGLEVIEARWLFDIPYEQIEVVVQPQSIIHSMVEYIDGGIIAQLGTPDMKLPIQYALYEGIRNNMSGEKLDFTKLHQLTFEVPDLKTFNGLALGYDAGKVGGSMPTVYNAANEWAVAQFLGGKISYLDIIRIIESEMERHTVITNPSVEEILEIETETYKQIESRWSC